ncbi:hypothetical protein Tco_1041942 [Tanacetum coccineum]|uniref:Uncharacterized protein n=1 Tax=Tanacetum coccineum TaxID=301880 RepID=A0ABQ5GJZ6_9ASTR
MGSQCSCLSQGAESDHVSITTSELENECPPDQNQMEMQVQNGDGGNEILCLQQSPAIGTAGEERIESNAQQTETGQSVIEEQWLEIGSRKSIRMLFGRHDLLDLLKIFEIRRQKEIQSWLKNGPVSNFAHRNRLQSLMRGRFLWNQRFVQDKSTSVAAIKEDNICHDAARNLMTNERRIIVNGK